MMIYELISQSFLISKKYTLRHSVNIKTYIYLFINHSLMNEYIRRLYSLGV